MANSANPRGRQLDEITRVVEIERKLQAPAGFALPDLGDLPGVVTVLPPAHQTLDATYFDTADLRLAQRGFTLRRRTGGDDAGWHLKTPRRDGARDEHRAPLGRATRTVPVALRRMVAVNARGRELAPVVRLSTRRTVTALVGPQGRPLAEIAQDAVHASVPTLDGGAEVSQWYEVEVELVDGDRGLLEAVVRRLLGAGAAASPSSSKLAQALGDRLPAAADRVVPAPKASSAGAVVLDHLRVQVERLLAHDPLVRVDAPDAVHQMRVACRRLRSALASFRPLFDRDQTDPLREELAWLGTVLGEPRDAEVVRDHLRAAVEAQPPELVVGPVVQWVVDSLTERHRVAHDRALAELDGARYFALLEDLDRLLLDPPFGPAAHRRATSVLPGLAAHSYRRVVALVEAADAAGAQDDPAGRDLLLHDVRKAAKRARYAGESLAPRFGKDATRFATAMASVQEALGDHQDSVVIRDEILLLARQAHAQGVDTFTFGRLHALEEARGSSSEQRFGAAWVVANRPGLRRWMR